jgi:hypothetical protein
MLSTEQQMTEMRSAAHIVRSALGLAFESQTKQLENVVHERLASHDAKLRLVEDRMRSYCKLWSSQQSKTRHTILALEESKKQVSTVLHAHFPQTH